MGRPDDIDFPYPLQLSMISLLQVEHEIEPLSNWLVIKLPLLLT